MESYDLTTGTFSGMSKRLFYFSIAAFIAGAAMLVAGSVMLGVGIHKYNQNNNNEVVVPASTMTPALNSISPVTGTGTPVTPTGSAGPPTGAPDVLIMLDTSREIGSSNFEELKDYIATSIATQLPLGGSGTSFLARAGDSTNVGIVGFSDASVNILSYYEISDLASVQDALSAITLTNARTNPSKALTVMNKLGSTKVDNTNVMMVLASGTQDDLNSATNAFTNFISSVQNFTFVALGAAGKLDLSVLNNMDNVQTFNNTGYQLSPEDTNSLVNSLNPSGTTAVTPTIPPPPPEPTCNKDIAILIDQSVSVGTSDDFNRQIDYLVKSLVNSWTISSSRIETFGLLYSTMGTALLSTKPFNYNATSEFIADLNAVKGRDTTGQSDIPGGLYSLQSHLTNRRPNFDFTTILITYNSQFDYVSAVAEANNIGGNIIVVAVNTDPSNLYYLSGTVIETDKFFYDNITQQINTALCAPPVPPSPIPSTPATPTPSPTPTVPPPTCDNDVAILIDQSVAVGNVTDLNRQVDFITNTLVNTWTISSTNIETIAVLYSQLNTAVLSAKPFQYDSTQQFITDIKNGTQGKDPFGYNDITAGLSSLQSHLNNLRPGKSLSVILFTYNDDLSDILTAIPEAQNIPGKIIVVAVNTIAGNLYYLSGTVIQTDKFFNWDIARQINDAICQSTIPPSPLPTNLPSPSPSSSTVTSPTTPPPEDFDPCRSNIVFALDASNNIGSGEFTQMKVLITDYIVANNWTHFERIGLMSYADSASCTYEYGNFTNKPDFDNTVNNDITQFANSNSIKFGIGTLMNTFIEVPLGIQNTIFFTSTSDKNDVAQASTNSHLIDYKGALIIVAIPPANKQDLLPLVANDTSKVIEFNPFGDTDTTYDEYARQILSQFYCGATTGSTTPPSTTTPAITSSVSPTSTVTVPTRHGVSIYTLQTVTPQSPTPSPTGTTTSPATPPTSPTSPTSTATSTSTPPTSPTTPTSPQTNASSTTVTPPPTQSTPTVPYIPCKSWIYFGVDDSQTLQNNDFKTQLNFISSAVGNITHPERIAAFGVVNGGVSWNNGLSISQIQAQITQMFQGGQYSLRGQFAALATNLNDVQTNSVPVGALIFISDTSDAALAGADLTFNDIQNARITFVLLGNNVDASKLAKYSNYTISWTNLAQPQPDNWDNLYGDAYGCQGSVSTIGPTSTVTTTVVTPSTTPQTSPSVTSPTSPTSTVSGQTTSSQITTTGSTPAIPYIPCESWIGFAVDDSKKLDPNFFTNQLNFISSAIENINHPERIAALSVYNDVVSWNSGLQIGEIQNTVQNMIQIGDYRLRLQFAAIATALSSIPTDNTVPIGVLVFVSDTSDAALAGAEFYMDKMPNVRITFVLLGQGLDQNKLTNFSTNFITWSDLSQPQPDNWNNVYGPAYGCNGGVSTPGPTSTVTTVSPTSSSATSPTSSITSSSVPTTTSVTQSTGPTSTPAPGTYFPCQNWITVLADTSNKLTAAQFQAQLNFIKSNLNQITHPERIRYGSYNELRGTLQYPFDPSNTQQGLADAVDNTNQTTSGSNVLKAIQLLVSDENQNRTTPDSTLIFVTDTSNNIQIQQAVNLYNADLKPLGIKLTFILAGQNTNANALQGFDDAIFFNWQNIGFFAQPDRWDLSTALRCTPLSSTTTGSTITSTATTSPSTTVTTPSTLSSTISSTVTSRISSVSPVTSTSGPSTSPSSYIPCQSWISFSIDDSNKLSAQDFKTETNFVSSLVGTLNHAERIRAGGMYNDLFDWNNQNSIASLQQQINGIGQIPQAYSLRAELSLIVNDLQNIQPTTYPIGALVFISDTSDQAIAGADQLLPQLVGVQITFVLLGPGLDQNKLTRFSSNFIIWSDLSQQQPNGWNDTVAAQAYGCTSITTLPSASPTSSSSTVSVTSPPTSQSSTSTSITFPSSSPVTSPTQTSTQSTGSTSTPAPGTYYPCQNWITVLTDTSNKLSASQFLAQLNFTKVALNNVTHPERIRYGSYNELRGTLQYPFDPSNTQQGLADAVDNTNQTTSGSNVLKAIQLLVSDENQNRTTPDSTLIFVTDTSNNIQIQSAVNLYNADLKPLGIKLTFILVGQNTNANALQGFDDVIIYNWQNIGFFSQPDGWDLSTALRCTTVSSTTSGSTVTSTVSQSPFTTVSTQGSTSSASSPTSISSTMSPVTQSTNIPSSTTPSTTYIPCQSWISFGIDDSSNLNSNDFMTQLNFVSNTIGGLNHFERIAAVGGYSQPVTWNSGLSLQQIQNAVTGMSQAGPYSLRNQFSAILTNLQNTPTNGAPIGALIFISDTSNTALGGANEIFGQLQNVRITFVLLGSNVDQSKLTQFSSNFITWSDLSQSQPNGWNDTVAAQAYGCNGVVSTISPGTTLTPNTSPTTPVTPSTSTIVSTVSSSTTQTIPSSSQSTSSPTTSMTGPTTTGATPSGGPYIPCQVVITTLVDVSNAINIDQFQRQLKFTKNILSEVNHPERIRFGQYFISRGDMTYVWNASNTQEGLQAAIDNTTQTSEGPGLGGAMRVLMNNIYQNTSIPDATLIFVADTTNSIQITTALSLYNNNLKNRGVQLTFVLAGNKTDATALQGFTDAIIFNWQNMNNSNPDGWDLSQAFRCTTVSSTTSGSTVTTTVSQSPSTTLSTQGTSSSASPQTFASPTVSSTTQSTSSPSSTTTSSSYIPCQSWISFGVDDSNKLDANSFTTQLNFVSSAIGNITHPERIAVVGGYDLPVPWNNQLSTQQIQRAVTGMSQAGAGYSLRMQFSAILTNLQNSQLDNNPIGALIFISDTSDGALANADEIFGQLQNVRITFVLLGQGLDQSKLTRFSTNFITWSDFSQPQPDNWNGQAPAAYGCIGDISTVSPGTTVTTNTSPTSTGTSSTSTLTSTVSSSTTQTIPSTSQSTPAPTTSMTGPTPSGGPYDPCQTYVTALVDISNILTADQFKTQLNFTKNILSQVNHLERVRFGTYFVSQGNIIYPWDPNSNQEGLQAAIDNTTQTNEGTSLFKAMQALLQNENQNQTNIPDSTLIFVTDTSNGVQINTALNSYNSFLKNRTKLTFILVGQNTNANALQGFDDAIIYNWQNIGFFSQPDGWDLPTALRCTSTSSATTGSTVTTSVTQSPSTTVGSSSASSPTSASPTMSPVTQSSNIPSSTTTSSSYIPCQSWISFGIDDSNTLSQNDFIAQLNFVSSTIGGLNHFERIAAVGGYSQPVTWNSGLSLQQIQNAVTGMSQAGASYSLRMQFSAILTNLQNIQINNIPVGALIFISDTSDQAVAGASDILDQLQNVRITFVLLGPNVDQNKLAQFSSNFISWSDLSQPQPNNWNDQAPAAYGCTQGTVSTSSSSASPSPSPTTTPISSTIATVATSTSTTSPSTSPSSMSTSSAAPNDYYPCQSWISFSFDDSNGLDAGGYSTQIYFISRVIGTLNHAERIRASGVYSQVTDWEDILSIQQIQNILTTTPQTALGYSLSLQFASLAQVNTNTSGIPVAALIFISDTSDTALADADRWMPELANVRITFVLLGPNADQNKLTQFSSNFITWTDLLQPQPDNWNDVAAAQAYGCTTSTVSTVTPITVTSPSTVSPTRGGITVHTTQAVTAQSSSSVSSSDTVSSTSSSTTSTPPTSPSTSPSSISTSTAAPNDYYPCQSWISFSFDDSNGLNAADYSTQINFISTVIGTLNHAERIRASGVYTEVTEWEDFLSIQQIQNLLTTTQQTANNYSLSRQFAIIAQVNTNTSGIPIGALIFISDTSDAALAGADRWMPELANFKITFVLLGPNADQNKLTQFSSNFISWSDLSQPKPNGWNDNVAASAFGCTVSTVTPFTTTSASTVSPTRGGITLHTTQPVTAQSSSSVSTSDTVPSTSSSMGSTQSTGPTSTPAPGTYFPCQNWITVLTDTSNKLAAAQFLAQLNFTKVLLSQVTNPERIRYGSYNEINGIMQYTFDPSNTQQGLQAAIDNTTQTNSGSNVLKAIQLLVADENQNQTIPDATLIFVTDTSNNIQIQQAVNLYNADLKPLGIKLTFILVGQNTNANALQGFDDAIFYNWQNIGFFSQPDGWDLPTALRCTSSPVTASSSSPISSSSGMPAATSTILTSTSASSVPSTPTGGVTVTTTPEPYKPCTSWIGFVYDDSVTLADNDFRTQMNFISNAIGGINYPDRLLVQGAFTDIAGWNSHQTVPQMQRELNNSQKTQNAYKLLQAFGNLVTNLNTVQESGTNNWSFGVLVFISDTSPSALANANLYIQNLTSIELTFVLLGSNADPTKLTNFTTNFIYWTDLSQPEPNNWENSFYSAYGCNGLTTQTPQTPPTSSSTNSPVTVPSTLTSTSATLSSSASTSITVPTSVPTSTQTSTQTSTTLPSTSGTTTEPYKPCQSWISFSYDDSATMQGDNFRNQISFISQAIGDLNYPDRLRVNGAITEVASWNSHQTISQMQSELNSIQPTQNTYSLLLEFAGIKTDLESLGTQNWPIGALIFISDTSTDALANADHFFPNSTQVRITFVMLGSNVDTAPLTKYSNNFITWSDLSQPKPDNWDNSFYNAYGCNTTTFIY